MKGKRTSDTFSLEPWGNCQRNRQPQLTLTRRDANAAQDDEPAKRFPRNSLRRPRGRDSKQAYELPSQVSLPGTFLLAAILALTGSNFSQEPNPRFVLSIDGPCGETIVGPPGSVYDDHTGGAPYFNDVVDPLGPLELVPRMRPGYTWDIALTTSENHTLRGVWAWELGVGVDGPLRITDVTTTGQRVALENFLSLSVAYGGGGT